MIDDLRAEIDRIDKKVVKLLNQRASTALDIGAYKTEHGWDVTDEEREEAVLNRIKDLNNGPFSDEQIERIFRQLISETKEVQLEVDADDSGHEARSN